MKSRCISAIHFAAIVTAVGLYGCPPSPVVPPGPPDADSSVPAQPPEAGPSVDAAPMLRDAPAPVVEAGPLDACGRACSVLAALNCPESKPTPHGSSCRDVCLAVEGFKGISLHPGSVAACTTVACVRKAGVACKQ